MLERTTSEAPRDSLYRKHWMDFTAWDNGNVEFWLDEDGEVAAYLRWDDSDSNGIAFFEVRDKGCGIGSQIIRQLQAEKSGLYISGDIDNEECRRFWARMGFDVADADVVRE